jgi:transposase-like protein
MIAVFYYYRFKLSLNDVVILMAMRNIYLSHQTVASWVLRFGVDIGIKISKRRHNQGSDRWHADATYIKVEGRWCYLYRAIDKEGNPIDVYLSDVRDQAAAKPFSSKLQ